jgi:hypothetical protein
MWRQDWIALDNRWPSRVREAQMQRMVPLFVLDHDGVKQFTPTVRFARRTAALLRPRYLDGSTRFRCRGLLAAIAVWRMGYDTFSQRLTCALLGRCS